MADSTDKLLRDYFSGRLKLMAEIDPKHKQDIVDITFCLSVIKPEHSEVIKRYYSDKFITWNEVVSEACKSNSSLRTWRNDFKTLLNIILQHGDKFINLRQEALQA
ncbi:hypothetical protein LCIT_19000 [Leuconostoc citreum]|uniref:Uncharacterized protein n=1 Tax=Leuconostoc citreum TaxID=33964 RepID=A0A5A5U2J0_LEUCI|nr:hypothetical protein [Leuconostoc citreum]GDZ84658.1 hypothetical protein LCIT_19000 [Leuconostoc citreum]